MPGTKKISSALISVYHKDGLEPVIRALHKLNVTLYATGGTQTFIESLSVPVVPVEELTSYPSILGGRVKTLHPKVFGGILSRRDNAGDAGQLVEYEIPGIDLVIVDLYPFEETVSAGAPEEDIIEKIDIGGISLIRAAAKNFHDVVIVPSLHEYETLLTALTDSGGFTTLDLRRQLAVRAFAVSSHYDTAIWNWMGTNDRSEFHVSIPQGRSLRYGENPHQKGYFYGDLEKVFTQLSGKELSYNNLLDIDAALALTGDFDQPVTAILKHNNACGIAAGPDPMSNWKRALEADPVSAFGGIIVTNQPVDESLAAEIGKLFFEVLMAPEFIPGALALLKEKKNRILLQLNKPQLQDLQYRTILNGVLAQDRDAAVETASALKTVTRRVPEASEISDLLFANIVVKHSRSNTIVLVKEGRLLAAGVGQTSRVDALQQAIDKAGKFKMDLKGAVMASDAFFPFPDCVEIAHQAGIAAVIQPGGSIRDQESIDYCDKAGMAMVVTGTRHFRH
ncbi:MAG TPA: bifunctional phosphoribosylaminoimidazolecarboxamide formyltransferase/IMP cyclohydrolase [Bacteroidia bacterium]|nr:bifunctional phosphoribosylaminoimidazolecarboxamide formyltransferase/IMP cyclohydrolase [Bacteroidia bacterium]